MSWQATSWVTAHSKHKGSDLLCLLMIANHADGAGKNAPPSVPTLAAECRLSERQIQRIIQNLEASGELVVERSQGRKKHVYTVVMGDPNGDILSKPTVTSCPKPAPNGDKMTPSTVTSCPANGDIMSPAYKDAPACAPARLNESSSKEEDLRILRERGQAPPALALFPDLLSMLEDESEEQFEGQFEGQFEEETKQDFSVSQQTKSAAQGVAPPPRVFVPPTLDAAQEYFASLGHPEQATDFHDYYQGNGWHAGKSKIKDWQATARRWERRQAEYAQTSSASTHKGKYTHVPSAKSVTADAPQLTIQEYRKRQAQQQAQQAGG